MVLNLIERAIAVSQITKGQVIAIDGKSLRSALERGQSRGAIHMVNAWATENRLVLGQTKVTAKSNEITAIPQLLKLLTIEDRKLEFCLKKKFL